MEKAGHTASFFGVVKCGGEMSDAGPMGFGAFALTTFIFSLYNTGWAPNLIWITVAIFYGGVTQFIAGMFEFKRNQVFAATFFATYGSFYLGLGVMVLLFMTPGSQFFDQQTTGAYNVGWYLTGFFVFNTIYLICALQTNIAVLVTIFLMELSHICLMAGYFNGQQGGVGSAAVAGGYFGFFCSAVAFYTSLALTFNCQAGRIILPIGSPIVDYYKLPPPAIPYHGAVETPGGAPPASEGAPDQSTPLNAENAEGATEAAAV